MNFIKSKYTSLAANQKIAIILILAFVVVCVGFFLGKIGTVDKYLLVSMINEYDKLETEYNDYKDAKQTLDELNAELKEKQELLNRVTAYEQDINKYDKEISEKSNELQKLYSEIEDKKNDMESLDSQIETKQAKLDKLTTEITKAQSEPRILPAGSFVVGNDIEPGRYSVTGRSNFVVRDVTGSIKVNTILGGSWGVDEYVCTLVSGDTIEAEGKDTYTPIN